MKILTGLEAIIVMLKMFSPLATSAILPNLSNEFTDFQHNKDPNFNHGFNELSEAISSAYSKNIRHPYNFKDLNKLLDSNVMADDYTLDQITDLLPMNVRSFGKQDRSFKVPREGSQNTRQSYAKSPEEGVAQELTAAENLYMNALNLWLHKTKNRGHHGMKNSYSQNRVQSKPYEEFKGLENFMNTRLASFNQLGDKMNKRDNPSDKNPFNSWMRTSVMNPIITLMDYLHGKNDDDKFNEMILKNKEILEGQ